MVAVWSQVAVRAFVLYPRFGLPFERLERLMFDLFGLEISEGALASMQEDSAPAFEKQTGRIRERLLSGTALESDETSARVGKKTWWAWGPSWRQHLFRHSALPRQSRRRRVPW